MPSTTKICEYCGRLFQTGNLKQRFCLECEEERMDRFKQARRFRTCEKCRTVFLSVDGSRYCDRCKLMFGEKLKW